MSRAEPAETANVVGPGAPTMLLVKQSNGEAVG